MYNRFRERQNGTEGLLNELEKSWNFTNNINKYNRNLESMRSKVMIMFNKTGDVRIT